MKCPLPLAIGGKKAALGAMVGGIPGAIIGASMGKKKANPPAPAGNAAAV